MKYGSIAIVNQVRVVSKQRIYDPKTNFDVLAGIKLSTEKLMYLEYICRAIYLYIVYRHERIHVPRI